MPVSAASAWDKTGRVDLDALVDAAVVAERSKALVGTERGISPKGASSAFQIIEDTFNRIKRRRPDLPDISHEDLNDPDNELKAREYAKAVISDFVNRGFTEPEDIASLYNSGLPWKKGKRIAETKAYVPRFVRALEENGAAVESSIGSAPSASSVTLPVQDDRGILERIINVLGPTEAQAQELSAPLDAGAAFENATDNFDAGAAFDQASTAPQRFAITPEDQVLAAIEQSDLPDNVKEALIQHPSTTGLVASFLGSGVGRQGITAAQAVTHVAEQLFPSRPQKEKISLQTALAQSPLGSLFGIDPNVEADERLRAAQGSSVQDILGNISTGTPGSIEEMIGLGLANRDIRTGAPTQILGGGVGIAGDIGLLRGSPRSILNLGVQGTGIGAFKGASVPGASLEDIKEEAIGTGTGFALAGAVGRGATALFPANTLARVGVGGGVFGGLTAAQGGTLSQVTSSGVLGSFVALHGRPDLRNVPVGKRFVKLFDPLGDFRFTDDIGRAFRESFTEQAEAELAGKPLLGFRRDTEIPFTIPEAFARRLNQINRPAGAPPFAPPRIIAVLRSPEFPGGRREVILDDLNAAQALVEAAQKPAPLRGAREIEREAAIEGESGISFPLFQKRTRTPIQEARDAAQPPNLLDPSGGTRLTPFEQALPPDAAIREPVPLGAPRGPADPAFGIKFFHEVTDPILRTVTRRPGLPDPSAFVPTKPVPVIAEPFRRSDLSTVVDARVNDKGQFIDTAGKPVTVQTQAALVDQYTRLNRIAEHRMARGESPFGPASKSEIARTRRQFTAAEKAGLVPEGTAEAEASAMKGVGVTDQRRVVADLLMANGMTPVPSRSGIEGALLPPAGEASVKVLSKADITSFVDRWGPEWVLRYRAPQVIMRSHPFMERIMDLTKSVAMPAMKTKLQQWQDLAREVESEPVPAFAKIFGEEGIAVPRVGARAIQQEGKRFGRVRRLLPEADRIAIGKLMHEFHLRNDVPPELTAETRRIAETRPDLVERANRLRPAYEEAKALNFIRPEDTLDHYFPTMVRHGDIVGDLPKAMADLIPEPSRTRINVRLSQEILNLSRRDIAIARDYLTKRGKAEAAMNEPRNVSLRPRADVIGETLKEAAKLMKRDYHETVLDYMNFMLKTSAEAGVIKNQSVDMIRRAPDNAFFGNIDKARTEFNTKLLEYDIKYVNDVYFRGAARRFAFNSVLPEIRALQKALIEQFGTNHRYVNYTTEFIDSALGRRADKFGQRMADFFGRRKTVQKLAESDIKAARKIAAKLTRPNSAREVSSTIRGVQAVVKLGFNTFFGAINLLQPYTFALSKLGVPLDKGPAKLRDFPLDVALTPARYARGLSWIVRGWPSLFTNRGIWGEANRGAVADRILDQPPKFSADMSFTRDMSKKVYDAFNSVLLSTTWANRVITYSAGYQRALSALRPKIESGEITLEQAKLRARAFARFISTEGGEFEGGPTSTPIGLTTPVGGFVGQFKSFTIQTLETLVNRMDARERLVFVTAVLMITGPSGIPVIKNIDKKNEWFPSLARALNIDFSPSIGWSMTGIPYGDREVGNAVVGVNVGGLYKFGETVYKGKPLLEFFQRQVPAINRVVEGRTTKEKLLGDRDLDKR